MPLEHIHPMIVHFPIALALLALAFDLWWVIFRRGTEAPLIRLRTGTVVLTLGALAAILAYMFGDMAYDIAREKGVAEAVLETHEGMGTATAILFVVAALLRLFLWWKRLDEKPAGIAVAILASVVVVVMVVITAYFGGALVYDHGVNVGAMH